MLMKEHVKTCIQGAYYGFFHELGTTAGSALPLTHLLGVHPAKNYQKGVFPGITGLMRDAIVSTGYKVKDTGCWNCYMRCGSLFDVPEGPFHGTRYENPEYETMWSFGANCWNSDFAGILAANKVCDDYGADTISVGSAVAFLMECYEKGYISTSDINGVELTWGDPEAMVAVAKQIVNRESKAGNWIADGGVRYAAERVGRDAEDFAMHAKGLELPAYDPRGLQAHGLGYAVSNIGGSHQIGYSYQEIFGRPEKVDRFSTNGKGRLTIDSNRVMTIFDCAVACGFANSFTESKLDTEALCHWLQLATGIKEPFDSPDKLNMAFDRIYNIERAFNLRMGLSEKEDTLPKRILEEPIPDGPSSGHTWHRDELLKDYYKERGWDEKTGVPLKSTLEDLNLAYVADDLKKAELMPTP